MEKPKLLIVDDEWNMRNLIRIYLNKQGFHTEEARNGREALEKINNSPYHLLILDVMMPELNGWEVCKEVREQGISTPILMLTARTDTSDKVRGLDIGADDYLTKPFEPEELVARIQALLRRMEFKHQSDEHSSHIKFGEFTMDLQEYQVLISNHPVHLTPKEFELLKFLLMHPKQVFNRDQLLVKIWGMDFLGDERTVDSHIKSIRKKLKKDGFTHHLIETVWGVGYKGKGLDKE